MRLTSRCPRCGRKVRYVRQPDGPWLPLDLHPHPLGNLVVRGPSGEERAIQVGAGQLARLRPGEARYVCHYSTCTNAGR